MLRDRKQAIVPGKWRPGFQVARVVPHMSEGTGLRIRLGQTRIKYLESISITCVYYSQSVSGSANFTMLSTDTILRPYSLRNPGSPVCDV